MAIAGMTIYQIFWYFLIYSCIGWCVEVVFHAVSLGKIINRGFLNGPVCPVYGFGMIMVLGCGNMIAAKTTGAGADATKLSGWMLFLFGLVLATMVELIAGWLLDKLFHARWWDYSDKPFNFHGYICPEFSILWGLGAILVVKGSHPIVSRHTFSGLPPRVGWTLMAFLYAVYFVDFVVTVMTVRGLNKKLTELEKMRQLLRTPSNFMSETLGTSSMTTAQVIQEGQVQAALAGAELKDRAAIAATSAMDMAEAAKDRATAAATSARDRAEAAATNAMDRAEAAAMNARERMEAAANSAMDRADAAATSAKDMASAARDRASEMREELEKRYTEMYEEILGHKLFGTGRLLRAFPNLRHEDYTELVEALKKRIDFGRNSHQGE